MAKKAQGTEYNNILDQVNKAIRRTTKKTPLANDDRRVAKVMLSRVPGLQNIDQVIADMEEVFFENKGRRMSEIESVRSAKMLIAAIESGLIGPNSRRNSR